MKKSIPSLAAFVLTTLYMFCRPAEAYVVDSHVILYADENASGYRRLTSAEPSGGDDVPLSYITVYPESDMSSGFEVSYREEEGPDAQSKNSTLIFHTNIPLTP
jgi:hypothetical protein